MLSYLPIGFLVVIKKFVSAQVFPLSRAIVVSSLLCLISLIFAIKLANEQLLRLKCLSSLI